MSYVKKLGLICFRDGYTKYKNYTKLQNNKNTVNCFRSSVDLKSVCDQPCLCILYSSAFQLKSIK